MKSTISGQFYLSFTTDQLDKLPTMHKLTNELQVIFASVLEGYLSNLDVEYEEVHAILADKLDCEEQEEPLF